MDTTERQDRKKERHSFNLPTRMMAASARVFSVKYSLEDRSKWVEEWMGAEEEEAVLRWLFGEVGL